MSQDNTAIHVEVLDAGNGSRDMATDIRAAFEKTPKDLSSSPKYFYDARGSELFEQITALPEYYQTRTELSILRDFAGDIISAARPSELIELGSGSASKTRALLDAMQRAGCPMYYVPLDVSASALRGSASKLVQEYLGLRVRGFVCDFGGSLDAVLRGNGRRLVVFLGGTIGNFTPHGRLEFLSKVRSKLRMGDHLLIGVDLVKDATVLEAAYDDAAGVTAEFNKNLLRVLNQQLGGEFDLDLFKHRAVYNEGESRIEMWLYSTEEQEVAVKDLGIKVPFTAGEGMRTEISTKFTRNSVERLLADSGFKMLGWYTDKASLFGLALGGIVG